MIEKNASVHWEGRGKEGQGQVSRAFPGPWRFVHIGCDAVERQAQAGQQFTAIP